MCPMEVTVSDTNVVDVVFSFDTTGSMYPCLAQLRRKLRQTVTQLFSSIPGLRVGLIAHGDYCDEGSTYLSRTFQLNRDADALCRFVDQVGPTGGGDLPEAYEHVLREARGMQWSKSATRVLVMIGDDVPHGPHYPQNRLKLDWRVEATGLAKEGVTIYAVQALNRGHATAFYKELAERGCGYHLPLNQLDHVTELILAVCARQQGPDSLQQLEQQVTKQGRMSRGVGRIFDTLLDRSPGAGRAAPAKAEVEGRFQVLDVDRDCAIRDFVQSMGLVFQKGRGFYQWTKASTIQPYKEIVVFDRQTGDIFTNSAARELLGIPEGGGNVRLSPSYDQRRYEVFVQSTSVNRALKAGTRFMYEVDGWKA